MQTSSADSRHRQDGSEGVRTLHGVGVDTLRVVGQETRDDTHRVQRAECTAGLLAHVAPEQQREKALLGRVEEVPEVAAIFVPAAARGQLTPGHRAQGEGGGRRGVG